MSLFAFIFQFSETKQFLSLVSYAISASAINKLKVKVENSFLLSIIFLIDLLKDFVFYIVLERKKM